MRAWPVLIAIAAVAYGCDSAPAGAGAAQQPDAAASTGSPTLVEGSLALFPDPDDNTKKLTVGSRIADFNDYYPHPKRFLPVTTLPKRLPAEDYFANGWESIDGTEGAGFITYERSNKMAAAIIRQTVDTRDEADKIVTGYKSKLLPLSPLPTVHDPDNAYVYTFWEDNDNRLMILETPVKGDRWELTFALGVKQVLDPLRADPADAKLDVVSVKSKLPLSGPQGASSGP